jgi:hypothetical protein
MRMATIVKQLEKRRDMIGKERDKLRDLAGEVSDLLEPTERAWDDIQSAIDTLSEQA